MSNKRFDFGLPLKDVFPPNEIHPRLKYLFKQAHRVCLDNWRLTVGEIIREHEGPLDIRLRLKSRIINDVDNQVKKIKDVDNHPGAYFWVIRHFLDLMPTPLLPQYVRRTQLNWDVLADRCHKFMQQYYETEQRIVGPLDYDLARYLDSLPMENYLLVYVLLAFIRKVSLKPICQREISRRTLVILAKYFSPSVGSIPYVPGRNNEPYDRTFAIFFYLLARWRYIEKNCRKIGYRTDFLDLGYVNIRPCRKAITKDKAIQTILCLPEVTVYAVQNSSGSYDHLKDAACQTVAANEGVRNLSIEAVKEEEDERGATGPLSLNLPVYTAKYDTFEEVKSVLESLSRDNIRRPSGILEVPPVPGCSGISTMPRIVATIPVVKKQGTEALALCTNSTQIRMERQNMITCSTLAVDSWSSCEIDGERDWNEAMSATRNTLTKVKEYNYDDQATSKGTALFRNRSATVRRANSMVESSRSLPARECKRKVDKSEMYFRQSYFSFGDVFEKDGTFKLNEEEDEENGLSSSSTEVEKTPDVNLDKIERVEDDKVEDKLKNMGKYFKRFEENLSFLRHVTTKNFIRRNAKK